MAAYSAVRVGCTTGGAATAAAAPRSLAAGGGRGGGCADAWPPPWPWSPGRPAARTPATPCPSHRTLTPRAHRHTTAEGHAYASSGTAVKKDYSAPRRRRHIWARRPGRGARGSVYAPPPAPHRRRSPRWSSATAPRSGRAAADRARRRTRCRRRARSRAPCPRRRTRTCAAAPYHHHHWVAVPWRPRAQRTIRRARTWSAGTRRRPPPPPRGWRWRRRPPAIAALCRQAASQPASQAQLAE
eukprot:COSAG01_NODE_3302_length_6295_cov_3.185765_9_plen_242_part_00